MSLTTFAALALCGLIGVSLGLLGGGGSILALPVLVYVAGVEPHRAVAMSLAIVGSTSLTAAFLHRRGGRVDARVGALFGLAGLPGALLGSQATRRMPPDLLLVLFGALMLVVGALMIARSLRDGRGAAHARARHPVAVGMAGFGVGLLTGFLGIGGGFIIVPALVFFTGLAMPDAVGTSLVVIAFNCAAGLLGHIGQGEVPLRLTAMFSAAAIAGGAAGERLAARTAPRVLRRAFGILVIALGLYVLARNLLPRV